MGRVPSNPCLQYKTLNSIDEIYGEFQRFESQKKAHTNFFYLNK